MSHALLGRGCCAGSVVRLSNDTLDVRHKSGRVIRLSLDSTTTTERQGTTVPLHALGPKQRVSVTVDASSQTWRAQRVVIHSGR